MTEPAVKLTQSFISEGNMNDDDQLKSFKYQFKELNTVKGSVISRLPYGCIECRRIHQRPEDVILTSDGQPECVRCGRTINLKG